jgi:plasmid stability protein
MGDLLIRGIPDQLKRLLQEEAIRHGRNLSEEAKIQIQKGIAIKNVSEGKAGDHMATLLNGGFFTEAELQDIEASRSESDRLPPDLG